MPSNPIRILYVEDDEQDYLRVQNFLSALLHERYQMDRAPLYDAALQTLERNSHDVYLVSYDLSPRNGLELLKEGRARGCQGPIILLTRQSDRELDLKAMESGAADYLVKAGLDAQQLERSIRYSIERARLLNELRMLSLVDELTGLYNRRGFHALCEEQIKVAQRWKREMTLVFVDVDDMKRINDTWGHPEGDRALIGTASILKSTFRQADIVARIGGDEFAVLALETTEDNTDRITARLRRNLAEYNNRSAQKHKLSLSLGWAQFRPDSPVSIDELIRQADALMYRVKRGKTEARLRAEGPKP